MRQIDIIRDKEIIILSLKIVLVLDLRDGQPQVIGELAKAHILIGIIQIVGTLHRRIGRIDLDDRRVVNNRLWEFKVEPAASPVLALHMDVSAHQLDQLLGESEPESGSLYTSVFLGVRLREGLEYLVEILFSNPTSAVMNGDQKCDPVIGFVLNFNLDPDETVIGVFRGIADNVRHDLRDTFHIASHPGRNIGREVVDQLDRLAADVIQKNDGKLAHKLREFIIFLFELHLAGLDLGEIEDVVDDREKTLAGVLDILDVLIGLLGEFLAQKDIRHADDRVHRGPDIVGHIGQKCRLRLVAFLRPQYLHVGFLLPGDDSSEKTEDDNQRDTDDCKLDQTAVLQRRIDIFLTQSALGKAPLRQKTCPYIRREK